MESEEARDRAGDVASQHRLTKIQAISEAALAHLRFDELLAELLRRISDLLSTDTAAVLLLDVDTAELVARAARGIEEEVEQGVRIPVGRGFAGRIAAERRPIEIPDVDHADVLNPILRQKGIRSLLGVPLTVEGEVTGVLHVGSLRPRKFTHNDVELLQMAADRIAVAIDHARLYEAEREARAAAEAAAEQLRRLEGITEAALANLSLGELLDRLLERLREVLGGDTVAVMRLDPERGRLSMLAALGLDEWVGSATTVELGEGVTGTIAAEARPIAVEDSEATPLRSEKLDRSGIRSLLGVPLLVEGEVTGVLTVGSWEPRHFDAADIDLLARAGDRIAIAIENARLYESERLARAEAERAADRIRRIESITEVALHHIELDDRLLESLLARVRDVLAVDSVAVYVLDEEEQTLVARAAHGIKDVVERGIRVPLGSGFAGLVAERNEPVVAEDATQVPVISPLLRDRGIRSLLGVPLSVEGRMLGVLHVGTLHPRRFTEDDISLLELAGERLSVALEHSRIYEREHYVAETLQRSLLPERLPEVSGARIGVRYIAGADEGSVGGDWYDAVPLPGGRLGLAMGDVVSRGVRAAATMGQLRNALRAYALEDRPPAVVLGGVAAMLRSLDVRDMATLVYLVLDPHSLTYTLASAGHPPPLVVSQEGRVEYLEEGRSPPLGALADPAFEEATGTLEPGDTLLLYTDGIVEGRELWIDEGLGLLAAAAAARAGAEPDALIDGLVRDLAARTGGHDDIALLALQMLPVTGDALSLRLPAAPEVLTSMRRTLRRWLAKLGADETTTYDILVATTEAAANAVEHAYGPVDADFVVEARQIGDEVEIVVRDHGRWRPPRGQNRGRGTLLMQELMSHFEVVTTDAGTEVRMRRRLTEVNGALV